MNKEMIDKMDAYTNGYVVLPVEEYRRLILGDIRNASAIKVRDDKWYYGEVYVDISSKFFEDMFADTAKEMFPGIKLDDFQKSIKIGKISEDIMDTMLGKEPEAQEGEDAI